MKALIIILQIIFVASILTLTSCKKDVTLTVGDHETKFKVLTQQFLVHDREYVIVAFESEGRNLYSDLTYGVDDILNFDYTQDVGYVYPGNIQNAFEPFIVKRLVLNAYHDEHGVFIHFVDPVYTHRIMKLISYETASCSFTMSYKDNDKEYLIRYSKRI